MTLIIGARCRDGVVLVADSKRTEEYDDFVCSLPVLPDNKIIGGIEGVLIAYSGPGGVFTTRLRHVINYITQHEGFYEHNMVRMPFTIFRVQISSIQYDLWNATHQNYHFEVLLGISAMYFPDSLRSSLIYFYPHGTLSIIKDFRAIGSGAPFASYYLKRYWHNEMKMKEFAQLADFIIKYVDVEAKSSLSKYKLDNAVGLNPECPYPQVIYIPNNPNYCKPYNKGESRLDCSPEAIDTDM
jgi:20S proteasome alpha/beta subunit